MNYNILSNMASGAAGAAVATFLFSVFPPGFPGASIEGSALLLLASFVGFGVSRYYAVTDVKEKARSEGGITDHS